jgi:hypothetical protein
MLRSTRLGTSGGASGNEEQHQSKNERNFLILDMALDIQVRVCPSDTSH